jgi:hypothetical protein
MGAMLKAITVAGTIDEKRQLHLDDPLPVSGPSRVSVIILFPDEEREFAEAQWLHAAATNPAFDFLKEPEEDIYSLSDGRAFSDQG